MNIKMAPSRMNYRMQEDPVWVLDLETGSLKREVLTHKGEREYVVCGEDPSDLRRLSYVNVLGLPLLLGLYVYTDQLKQDPGLYIFHSNGLSKNLYDFNI